jgi:potassium-dependent mechanosensitive channel
MNDPRLQALLDQIETIRLLLERPVVQNQLLAFVAIFLLSWLLPEPLGALLNRLIRRQEDISKRRQKLGLPVNKWRTRILRWLRGAQLLLFPIVGYVSIQLTMSYFASRNWPLGLLDRLATIFWLLLVYQVVGSLLFGSMTPTKAREYRRRLVTPAFVILVVVSLIAGLDGAFPIARIVLFSIAGSPLTVSAIGTAVLVLYATFALGWLTKELLGSFVLPRAQVDSGVTNIIMIISRYTVLAIGILLAISIIGVDLSTFAIIGGGLSVGIGFGLQDLIANFISGILLLFEQTLRPGDVIEVAGQRGRVEEMRMRSAVLRTGENVDVYVPNKTLLTSVVADYTNLKPSSRKTINIGVSYDSDPIQVRDTLAEVVQSHGLVLKDPAPAVFFVGFGSFTLDFEVAVSISEPSRTAQILSDLHFMIYREFSKRGIEIPIPQQDFHLRSTSISPIEQLLAPPQGDDEHAPGSNGDQQRQQAERSNTDRADQHGSAVEAVKSTANDSPPGRVKAPRERPKLPG